MNPEHQKTVNVQSKSVKEKKRMKALLQDAIQATCEGRNEDYGTPSENYGRIRDLWRGYPPSADLDEVDAVVLMILTKIARIVESPGLRDSWLDIAGYAAVGWAVVKEEEDRLDEFLVGAVTSLAQGDESE